MNKLSHSPFHSFWMAGYECADHLNNQGNRVDLLKETCHLQYLDEDYRMIQDFNIRTVREGIQWSIVEKRPYEYDWSSIETMIRKGRELGIQQIWDICHFGFPDDLTPFHPHFVPRFEALCRAFVTFYRSLDDVTDLIITPINEVSFISWLGGDVAGTSPFCRGQGWQMKYELMKAYIRGIAAMKEIDPRVIIISTEPLVHIVPPLDATEEQVTEAALMQELQYQSVDMLCGRICPELGGSPDYLDILGFNYYYNNQWVLGFNNFLPWVNEPFDPRWKPLSTLIAEAYQRFGLPVVITETSHSGEDRPQWLSSIGENCAAVLEQDIPLWGVCLYPITDRPDWDNLYHWHKSGLWDFFPDHAAAIPERILFEPYADALTDVQAVIKEILLRKKALLTLNHSQAVPNINLETVG